MTTMSCCGQKRRVLRDASRIPERAPAPQFPSLQNPALLQHTGASSLIVRGTVTRIANALMTRSPTVADRTSAEKTSRSRDADDDRT